MNGYLLRLLTVLVTLTITGAKNSEGLSGYEGDLQRSPKPPAKTLKFLALASSLHLKRYSGNPTGSEKSFGADFYKTFPFPQTSVLRTQQLTFCHLTPLLDSGSNG